MTKKLQSDLSKAAAKLFHNIPISIWYVHSASGCSCMIVSTANKVRLARVDKKPTQELAAKEMLRGMQAIVGKVSSS